MYNELVNALQDMECELKGAKSAYTALGLEIDDLVDENKEVFTILGGLDNDTHDIIASYYDFKKQREKVRQDIAKLEGYIMIVRQMIANRKHKDKFKGATPPWEKNSTTNI